MPAKKKRHCEECSKPITPAARRAEDESRVSRRLLSLAEGARTAADFQTLHREIERANLASKPVVIMYAVYSGAKFLCRYHGMPRLYDTIAKARGQATKANDLYHWPERGLAKRWHAVQVAVRLMPGGDGHVCEKG